MEKIKKYVITIKIPQPVWKEVSVFAPSKKLAIEAVKQDFMAKESRQAYRQANQLPEGCYVQDFTGDMQEPPSEHLRQGKQDEVKILQVDQINKS